MTKYRTLIDHYRVVLGLDQKLKPVDIGRTSLHISNLGIKDQDTKALFTVAYFHLKIHTRFDDRKAQVTAYTLSEGVRLLGLGHDKESVTMEMITIPSKFYDNEDIIVNVADVALDYLERMIGSVEEALKERVMA